LKDFFDIIVVDAPCSGSGLFRRDPSAVDEWSEANVQLCSGRQQRILADVWPSLKRGGLLIYSTCSYSMEENEMISQWLMRDFPMKPFEVSISHEWKITPTTTGYRFWPHLAKGEGFYISAFVKNTESDGIRKRRKTGSLERVSKTEREKFSRWFDPTSFDLIKAGNNIYAWPLTVSKKMEELSASLQVIYSGVRTGQLMNDKLIPDHALALSEILPAEIPRIELQKPQAIDYLSRKDIHIEQAARGWHVVCFEAQELGWINVLEKRINNYYPREMRIRKEYR
jgi:NOL1/NOP2/fmu family ribosome biogenesis protein